MAEREQRTDECVINAFKIGNKQMAEQLLPSIRPAVVRTTKFHFLVFSLCSNGLAASPSCLLERYSYICLVIVHKCVANWRDE